MASASSDYTASVWAVNKLTLDLSLIQKYRGHRGDVMCVEFLDQDTLATGSIDKTIQVWSISKGALIRKIQLSSWIMSLQLLQNGLLSSGDLAGNIKAWNYSTGSLVFTLTGHKGSVNALALAGNNVLASGSDDFKGKYMILGHNHHVSKNNLFLFLVKGIVWNVTTKTKLYTLYAINGHTFPVSSVKPVTASVLATGSADNTIKMWKIVGKELNGTLIRTLNGHTDSVTCLDLFSLDTLMSGGYDQTIRFWDITTGNSLSVLNVGVYVNTMVAF